MDPASTAGHQSGQWRLWNATMSEGNGKLLDEGLMALKASFDGAKFQSTDAFDAAGLIMLGTHREQHIPDAVIMEVYGIITEGKNVQLGFTAKTGKGYTANIESFADLVSMMNGTLAAHQIEQGADHG